MNEPSHYIKLLFSNEWTNLFESLQTEEVFQFITLTINENSTES